jgi:predicted anti-sigma-YlaC factor YlaD
MISNQLTCQELVELVTEYLEDAMADAERARFEAHLAICTGCRNYLEEMRVTIALVGKLGEASIPVAARDELLAIFRNWKNG